jgi:hypothetical protein
MGGVSTPPNEALAAGPEDVPAFTLAERTVDVRGVLQAALFRGDLEARWKDIQLKMACLEHAQDENMEPDRAALQARADRFRYERDLITTEETEKWLEKRHLAEDDFSLHVLRCYWKGELGEKIQPDYEDYLTGNPEMKAHLTAEILLSGWFDVLAQDLQWRMAGYRRNQAGEGDVPARIEDQRTKFLVRHGIEANGLARWLNRAGADEAWLEEMLAWEAAYTHLGEAVITPEGLTRALRSQRLSLMRLDLEEIEFDSMEAAREAILCIKEDHLSMEEVARESRYPYLQREFILDELPQEWQIQLLSTPEGGMAGPFQDDDLIRLFRVALKFEPSMEDEAVRARLKTHLLQTFFTEICAENGLKAHI